MVKEYAQKEKKENVIGAKKTKKEPPIEYQGVSTIKGKEVKTVYRTNREQESAE